MSWALCLQGIDDVYLNTADPRYFNYMKNAVDELVTADGAIPTYKPEENELDSILMGRQLLRLYRDDAGQALSDGGDAALRSACRSSRGRLRAASGTSSGIQIRCGSMGSTWRSRSTPSTHRSRIIRRSFQDITHQFVLVEEHMRDPKTGLLYHGWDESKQQRWANKKTGLSPEFWGRAMGWYMMALVDTLDYYPADDAGRKQLLTILD